MVNQVVLILCIFLFVAAVGAAIYFGVEYKKCKDSQDSIKEIKSGMISDIKTMNDNSGADKLSPDLLNCFLDKASDHEMLSGILMRACSPGVKRNEKEKEICDNYLKGVNDAAYSCGVPKPSPNHHNSN